MAVGVKRMEEPEDLFQKLSSGHDVVDALINSLELGYLCQNCHRVNLPTFHHQGNGLIRPSIRDCCSNAYHPCSCEQL